MARSAQVAKPDKAQEKREAKLKERNDDAIASASKTDPTKKKRKQKKRHARNMKNSYGNFIHKCIDNAMADHNIDTTVSQKTILSLDNFTSDILQRLINEASIITKHKKQVTLSDADFKAAIRIIFKPNLYKKCNAYANNAISQFKATAMDRSDQDTPKKKSKST